MNNPRNIVLTGLPRAGTTLTCNLLNSSPDIVALFEPMQVELLVPGEAGADQVEGFFQQSRQSLLSDGEAYSQHVDGKIPDNPFCSIQTEDGRREHQAVRGVVKIDKQLDADFVLAIKHNGAFSALLPLLSRRMECFGFVRNPVSVLGSWSSIDLPVSHGRIPAAERLDAGLRHGLDAEPDLLARQLMIIDWIFQRFATCLDRRSVLRYEELVSSNGQALANMLGIQMPERALQSRNSSARYRSEQAVRWADALRRHGGAWREWYTVAEIVGAVEQLVRGE